MALQWRHPSAAAKAAKTVVEIIQTLTLSYVSPIFIKKRCNEATEKEPAVVAAATGSLLYLDRFLRAKAPRPTRTSSNSS